LPENRLVLESRGKVYYDKKDYLKALEDFNNSIRIDSTSADIYYHRGMTLLQLNNVNEALEDFTLALNLGS